MATFTARRSRFGKKPTYTRFLAAAMLVCGTAHAQGAELTETEVVHRVLARAPLREAIEGEIDIEHGQARSASRYPNPHVSYVREQTFGPLGTAEDALFLSQEIDLGNRRGLQGDAAEARARAARAEGDAIRLLVATDARLRFYELLYRQDRVRAFEHWTARVDEALDVVRRRERSGDAATYDVRRLERERAVAVGQGDSERAALEGAQARLEALLDMPAAAGVRGRLLPDTDPPELESLRSASAARPDLRALDLRVEAASRERTAANRGWVPGLLLQGGWKGVDFGRQGRSDGFILGGQLSLPLWDRGSGAVQTAEGEARLARGRRVLLTRELDAALAGARNEAVRLRRAASDFFERTNTGSSELVRIASAGYLGGELGLLELLDAYRSAVEDALTALDMAHSARRSSLELDRMTGAALP